MTSINIAALLNFLGFALGAALYAMLLAMVVRRPHYPLHAPETVHTLHKLSGRGLLLATALLGLIWNMGALVTYAGRDFGLGASLSLLLSAASYIALGFLPAVVVHSVLQSSAAAGVAITAQRYKNTQRLITIAAYSLSVTAGVLHLHAALTARSDVSLPALRILTIGYLAIIAALFVTTRNQPGWKRAIWASALAVFAVSALHLSHHHGSNADSWLTELTGHHASLPLALAILYQDYRFAFADLFLKRALALLALVALAFGLYVSIAAPLLADEDGSHQANSRAVLVLLGLWVLTALCYPALRRAVVRFVDVILLRRADYGSLRGELTRRIADDETQKSVLESVSSVIAPALSARNVRWFRVNTSDVAEEETSSFNNIAATPTTTILANAREPTTEILSAEDIKIFSAQLAQRCPAFPQDECVTLLERSAKGAATTSAATAIVHVPTGEPPYYAVVIGPLADGRRLLSDDIEMLESVALQAARRIDALRVTHERCEQLQREQEIGKLATEAQLRALRAQVNPHFLFNALTTIGYLINASPERALETLLKLTDLLRRVLRTTDEFVTLDEELKLIVSYLDIERARFEERLRVSLDIPSQLLGIRLPSLLIQPLVENAVKHGIAPTRAGGEVRISAGLETTDEGGHAMNVLRVSVSDTGAGASEIELARGRRRGVGLNNIEQRLHKYFGKTAALRIESAPGRGATVEIRAPIVNMQTVAAASFSAARRSDFFAATAAHEREKKGA